MMIRVAIQDSRFSTIVEREITLALEKKIAELVERKTKEFEAQLDAYFTVCLKDVLNEEFILSTIKSKATSIVEQKLIKFSERK